MAVCSEDEDGDGVFKVRVLQIVGVSPTSPTDTTFPPLTHNLDANMRSTTNTAPTHLHHYAP